MEMWTRRVAKSIGIWQIKEEKKENKEPIKVKIDLDKGEERIAFKTYQPINKRKERVVKWRDKHGKEDRYDKDKENQSFINNCKQRWNAISNLSSKLDNKQQIESRQNKNVEKGDNSFCLKDITNLFNKIWIEITKWIHFRKYCYFLENEFLW